MFIGDEFTIHERGIHSQPEREKRGLIPYILMKYPHHYLDYIPIVYHHCWLDMIRCPHNHLMIKYGCIL